MEDKGRATVWRRVLQRGDGEDDDPYEFHDYVARTKIAVARLGFEADRIGSALSVAEAGQRELSRLTARQRDGLPGNRLAIREGCECRDGSCARCALVGHFDIGDGE